MKSVKVTSGPFHSRGGVTIEVLPPVARRWPKGNGGIPPATCHPYPTSARRWANGGIPPATCHPYPTSARRSGAIWGTPSRTRSETPASPTLVSTTVTRTLHTRFSVNPTKCRTLPNLAILPPGLYCSADVAYRTDPLLI